MDFGSIASHLGCFVLGGMTTFAFVAMLACMKAGAEFDPDRYGGQDDMGILCDSDL